MNIYIASSWKNQHAVEMLTGLLRADGHTVLSFIENNHGEQRGHAATKDGKPVPFDQWCQSEQGERAFDYDTTSAATCDLLVYVGPSGCDAWAEVGVAWANMRPVVGLLAKGEQVGLMRRMVESWFDDYRTLLKDVQIRAAILDGLETLSAMGAEVPA